MRSYLGVPVPVYHFQQPARLSSRELPFKLLLVRKLNLVKVSTNRDLGMAYGAISIIHHFQPLPALFCPRSWY